MNSEPLEPSLAIMWYEQLRNYVLAPCTPLSAMPGLDIWLKKGFKEWIKILVSYKNEFIIPEKIRTEDPSYNIEIKPECRKELIVLIANMILSRR